MSDKKILVGDMSRETAIGILKLMLEAMEVYDSIAPTPQRRNAVQMAIASLQTDETYQLEYEKPEFCNADNSVLEDINKMLAEINGEIACAEYHEVECNHKTEKQDGRRAIAKIVHKYCDKYMESE